MIFLKTVGHFLVLNLKFLFFRGIAKRLPLGMFNPLG
jgi:hypothetical protein